VIVAALVSLNRGAGWPCAITAMLKLKEITTWSEQVTDADYTGPRTSTR
jgi:hypothetical protein